MSFGVAIYVDNNNLLGFNHLFIPHTPLASVAGLELKLTFCKLSGANIIGQSTLVYSIKSNYYLNGIRNRGKQINVDDSWPYASA